MIEADFAELAGRHGRRIGQCNLEGILDLAADYVRAASSFFGSEVRRAAENGDIGEPMTLTG
jgi:hypothetical protein